jgi:predicted ATPase/DNA-binding CsgD family transcriptional regulator
VLAGRRATAHADGGYVVGLSAEKDPRAVAEKLAASLSVERDRGQSLAEAVLGRLHDRDALIVLDDCEHVVTACGEFVESLLRWCPRLAVVATCREALGIGAETVWQVRPLALPGPADAREPDRLAGNPAMELFLARAREVQPDFTLTQYLVPDVVEIIQRLDGLPLSIELAAEWVGALTPAEIARRLDDRFDFLVTRASWSDPRHRSLRSAIDRSHDLLTEAERTVFRRLSVFAGRFAAEAPGAVCASPHLTSERVRQLLDRMVAKSLVMAEGRSDGTPRYRLLETIRSYASERLERSGEQAELRAAHAEFYLALAENAEPELTGREQEKLFERLEQEHANLRAAFEFAIAQGKGEWALRLSAALTLFWRIRGHFEEGRELLAAALASSDRAPDGLKAKAQWGEGFLCLLAGDPYGCVESLEQSFAGFAALEDRAGQARSLLLLGNARQQQDDGGALELLRRSAELAREAGDSWCLAHALGCLGFEHLKHSGSEIARPLFDESLRVAEQAGDKQGRRWGLLGLGALAGHEGDYREAERLLRQGIELVDELREDYLKAGALRDLGQVALGQGRYADASALLDESVALSRRFASPGAVVIVLCLRAQAACAEQDWAVAEESLDLALRTARGGAGFDSHALVAFGRASLALARGKSDDAAAAAMKGLELARASGERWMIAHGTHFSGRLARTRGDLRRAGVLLDEALTLYAELGNRRGMAGSLEAIGGLAGDAGDWERATRFLSAANVLREQGGTLRLPWEASSFDDDLANAEMALPSAVFAASLAEGAALSTEDVVAQALRCRQRGRPAGGWPSLTAREREVALLAGEGLTNPEIAERLVISLGTVKNHLAQVFAKLGISKRSELMRDASRQLGGTGVR